MVRRQPFGQLVEERLVDFLRTLTRREQGDADVLVQRLPNGDELAAFQAGHVLVVQLGDRLQGLEVRTGVGRCQRGFQLLPIQRLAPACGVFGGRSVQELLQVRDGGRQTRPFPIGVGFRHGNEPLLGGPRRLRQLLGSQRRKFVQPFPQRVTDGDEAFSFQARHATGVANQDASHHGPVRSCPFLQLGGQLIGFEECPPARGVGVAAQPPIQFPETLPQLGLRRLRRPWRLGRRHQNENDNSAENPMYAPPHRTTPLLTKSVPT